MTLRRKIEDRIRRKELEIKELEKELEARIREAKVYVQAMQDMLKLVPRSEGEGDLPDEEVLRPDGAVYKAMEFLKKTGRPLHISEILRGIGKPNSKSNRISLGGSLARYVKKGQIFTRTAPNTFWLASLEPQASEPPDDFGLPTDPRATDSREDEPNSVDVPF
jgi:hypothetical protein